MSDQSSSDSGKPMVTAEVALAAKQLATMLVDAAGGEVRIPKDVVENPSEYIFMEGDVATGDWIVRTFKKETNDGRPADTDASTDHDG